MTNRQEQMEASQEFRKITSWICSFLACFFYDSKERDAIYEAQRKGDIGALNNMLKKIKYLANRGIYTLEELKQYGKNKIA